MFLYAHRSPLTANLFLLLFFALNGCMNRPVTNVESKGEAIVCFGDSITRGLGGEEGEDYPSRLAKMIGIPVVNAGISGETSEQALKRLDMDVLAKNPLLVIIEFGGNDMLGKVPVEQTVANVEEIIRRVQSHGAMVALVDMKIHSRVLGSTVMGDYSRELKRLSKEYKVVFIPEIFKDIFDNPRFKSDNIHPNGRGYQIVAHRVYRAIIPYLNENIILRRLKNR